MRIAVVANAETKAAWLSPGLQAGIEVEWLNDPRPVPGADAYIDLEYESVARQPADWAFGGELPVVVNDVLKNEDYLPSNFARFNGWPSFISHPVAEVSGAAAIREKVTAVFAAFNRSTEWVPDLPGFITARVVCMIINEAWFSLEEQVSTPDEIDTAMKLGTNYPMGPFEWGRTIGLAQVYRLLDKLSKENSRYTPANLLKKEAAGL